MQLHNDRTCSLSDRKWQQIADAQKVALRDDTVSAIGEGIAEVAQYITEMDFQDNLLWEWEEVINVIFVFFPLPLPLLFPCQSHPQPLSLCIRSPV